MKRGFLKQFRWLTLNFFFGLHIKSLINLKNFGTIFRKWGGNCLNCPPGYTPEISNLRKTESLLKPKCKLSGSQVFTFSLLEWAFRSPDPVSYATGWSKALSAFYVYEPGLWSSSCSTYLRSQIGKTQWTFGGAASNECTCTIN